MRGSLRPKSGLELCMCARVTAQSLAFRMLLPAARSCRQRLHGRDTLPRSANPRLVSAMRALISHHSSSHADREPGSRHEEHGTSRKTAMHYRHPELDVVRATLDYRAASETTEMRA